MADVQKVEIVNKRPNHILHLLLSLVTCGLWIPVWIAVSGSMGLQWVKIGSDEFWSRLIIGAIVGGVALYLLY